MRYDFASLININIIFLSINNIFKFTFINLININIDLINVNIDLTNIASKLTVIHKINYSQFLIKIYNL